MNKEKVDRKAKEYVLRKSFVEFGIAYYGFVDGYGAGYQDREVEIACGCADAQEKQEARITELEKEVEEQCRLNGMGSEREAKHLTRITELERQVKVYRDALEKISNKPSGWDCCCDMLADEALEEGGCLDT